MGGGSSTLELGYWKIRGLGAPLRMILAYKGVQYEDKQYEDFDSWFQGRKPEILKMNPLANLPYVVDGSVCVCQTNAVFQYIGDKYGLNGKSAEAVRKNDQLLCEIYDVRNGMIELTYPFKMVSRTEEEYKANATKFCDQPPFSKFENWLEIYGEPYFCGTEPCVCDFHIWEMLDQHKILAEQMEKPPILDKFPKCKAFYERFREISSLQEYFKSDAYKLPINNPLGGAYFK